MRIHARPKDVRQKLRLIGYTRLVDGRPVTTPARWHLDLGPDQPFHEVSNELGQELRRRADPGIVDPEPVESGPVRWMMSTSADRWATRIGFALGFVAAVYLTAHVLARQFCGQ